MRTIAPGLCGAPRASRPRRSTRSYSPSSRARSTIPIAPAALRPAGLRAQLVVLAYGSDRFGVATSFEPFLRSAHADRDIGWFVLLAADVYLGPDHPLAIVDPRGSISPKLGGGLLF